MGKSKIKKLSKEDDYKSNVILGRISSYDWEKKIDKREFSERLYNMIINAYKYEDPNSNNIWIFGNGNKVIIDEISKDFVYFGRLGKVNKSYFDVYYDESKRAFIKEKSQYRRASYVNFIIYPNKNCIVFEEKALIKYKQFISYFTLIYTNNNLDSTISISPILKSKMIFEEINKLDKVTRAKFHLRPSNPESDDEFEKVDEMLKRSKTESARLEFENPKGLKVMDTIIEQAISLSDAGYGDYIVKGRRNNEEVSINSIDKIIRLKVKSLDNIIDIAKEFFSTLKPYLEKPVWKK